MVKQPKVATIQSIVTRAPIEDGLRLTAQQWDQLSALLTDYLWFSAQCVVMLEASKSLAAIELVNTWRSQAADLRDIIEGRE